MDKRSLFQCFHAKVHDPEIYCFKGVRLVDTGYLHIRRLIKGRPLEMGVCADCVLYDEMGDIVPPNERGWVK